MTSGTVWSNGVNGAEHKTARLSAADRAFFEKKIRPVLVKHCYSCHSEKAKRLGGKLRLDVPELLRKGGESGPAVVAGDPAKSLIVQSLKYEHLEMPPKSPLPKTVIKDFEDWVKRGAPDPRGERTRHMVGKPSLDQSNPALWSFQLVKDPAVPLVQDVSWPMDPLDRFVLARLEAVNLSPTRDASPRVLARRLYVDLIGLPPTLKQLAAFESAYRKDRRGATEQLVDELLASPHFGERWGRHWLDVARYAESNGNDGLGRNPTFPHAWRYRDYVIEAFNHDVPYDRFIMEQIAGDLLPANTPRDRDRQLIATGFLALGSKPAKAMNNNFDMDVVDDQIDVVSTGIMGLSVACARCHDHKHDPIPTRDYYAMAGIFKSTETLWGKAANEKLTAPATPLHELTTYAPPTATKKRQSDKPVSIAPGFASGYTDAIKALEPIQQFPLSHVENGIQPESGVKVSSKEFAAFKSGRIRGDTARPMPAYTVSFWFISGMNNDARPVTTYLFSYGPDSKTPTQGDHLGLSGTHNKTAPGRLFIFNGPQTKGVLTGKTTIPARTWNHVVYVRDGDHVAAYLNGNPKPDFAGDLERTTGETTTYFIGGRSDRFAPLLGNVAHFAMFDRALTADEAVRLHKASGLPKGSGKPLPASLFDLKSPAPPKAMAMGVRDRAKSGDCKINIKGESNKLGPVVPRGYLTACLTTDDLKPINKKQSGRLELAHWLVNGDHPQTARVMVNRIWLHLMGHGIVSTPDDFGVYGSRPTHPELLDHLAQRFVKDGWSIKRMIRNVVLSRTYQLSSRAEDVLIKADPTNALYTRHSRRRLDAESFRDAVLLTSGNLETSPGRGSVVQDMDVLVNKSGSLHQPSNHRSVYLCMLRNSLPPDLAAFDLPQFTGVKGRRDVTTLPSHTLYLLNNPLVIAQSRHLAQRALEATGQVTDEDRVSWIYRRVLNRDPLPRELRSALELVDATYRALSANGSDSQQHRVSAWAALCQALWLTNEFRYVD